MRRLTSRRSFLTASGLALATRPLWSQDALIFSSDVRVVNVLATVRNKDGDIVTDLDRDDFLVTEDNRPQAIKYFSRETNLPLILGLLVDTSRSQLNVLPEEESASYRFLDSLLREDLDKTFLAHFDFDITLLQDLTSSKEKLQRALEGLACRSVDFNVCEEIDAPRLGNRRGGSGAYGGNTTLYDAVYLASDGIMRRQEGRKAEVLLTDGVDHGSNETIGSAIEQAQRADTLIYSILFPGDEGGGIGRTGGMGGRKALQKMSRETGGGYFEVSREQSIDAIYKRIDEELRNQYSIGYTPDRPPTGGAFRTISLKTVHRDLVVQARQGYYPIS